MEIFIIAWLISGFAWWVKQINRYGYRMGIIGDIFIALPMCLVFGPTGFINEYFSI